MTTGDNKIILDFGCVKHYRTSYRSRINKGNVPIWYFTCSARAKNNPSFRNNLQPLFFKKDLVLHSNLVLNVKLSLFSNAQKSKEILYFLFIANKSGTIIIKGVEIFNTQHSNQSQPTRKFTLSTSQTNMLDSCWLLSSASVLRLFKRIGKAEHCKSAKSHLPSPSALSNHKNSKQYYWESLYVTFVLHIIINERLTLNFASAFGLGIVSYKCGYAHVIITDFSKYFLCIGINVFK